jgi:bifunctional UDP-N-acetylglucosamine pyrophosphorylase/glucosamine-1-phosphate N-acetyltransferase
VKTGDARPVLKRPRYGKTGRKKEMDRESEMMLPLPVLRLIKKGVRMPAPFSVDIGAEVDPDRISGDGVVFYGGTKIYGSETLISAGIKLGCEAPVTLSDCRLGREVELKGGFFESSVFLARASIASGAQVREGCLLEEEANGSHTVGLKQTILFPFVTLGSLINFCDCLLAGGTSRKDHSEVGSSYIHFNYTPNQDKATPSLLGDVPRGVMLKEPPIFLGGQGGLVGPARIGFGTVIAAGTIQRGDCLEEGKLLRGEELPCSSEPFHPGLYGDIRRRVINNILYLSNLLALRQWYIHVRGAFPADREMGEALHQGAIETLDKAVTERLVRFRTLAEKMEASMDLAERFLPEENRAMIISRQREFHDHWPEMEVSLTDRREETAGIKARDGFLGKLTAAIAEESDYIRVIRSLNKDARSLGTTWLRQAVNAVAEEALAKVPACRVSL